MKKKTINNLLFPLIVLTISFVWQNKVYAISCLPVSNSEFGYNGTYYETKDCLCYYYPESSVCLTNDTKETTSIDISFRDNDTGDYVRTVGFTIYQYVTPTGCSGEKLATGTSFGSVMEFPFKAYAEDIKNNSSICILVDSVPDGYAMPVPNYKFGSYETKTDILLSKSDESTGTLKLSFKDSGTDTYIKGIKWAITDTYSSTNGCSGTTIKTGISSSSISSITLPLSSKKYCLQVTEVPVIYSKPQDVSINMSVSTVTKSIYVDEKVIVDDTLSNISIAIIIVGIVGFGTGAYLIYENKKAKKLSE